MWQKISKRNFFETIGVRWRKSGKKTELNGIHTHSVFTKQTGSEKKIGRMHAY